MRRDVYWAQSAVDDLFELSDRNRKQSKRILDVLRMFAANGQGDLKKLQGREDEWRLRAGDWRIVMSLQGRIATVSAIDNRRDAYENR